MIKVMVLDDTGHTEFQVDTIGELQKEVKERGLEDKWYFVDGNYTKDLTLNEVSRTGVSEVHLVEPLIGG